MNTGFTNNSEKRRSALLSLRTSRRLADYEAEASGFFVSSGIAYIVLHVDRREDIISRYSVEGMPYLNGEFLSVMDSSLEHIPEKLPLVLELTGHRFTPGEEEDIRKMIHSHYSLQLGAYEYGRRGNLLRLIWFFLYLAVFLGLILFDVLPDGIINAVTYMLFYSIGDRFLESVFFSRRSSASQGLSLAQLNSMKIVFTETYDPRQLTQDEADRVAAEIEQMR